VSTPWAASKELALKASWWVGLLVLVIASFGISSAEAARTTDPLTGFGATIAHWNQHHSEDPEYARNAAYDPGPGLGDHKGPGDRYFAVTLESGRVESYDMRLLPGTGIDQAKREVLASEFPRDAKITWFKRKDTCAQMIVRSKTLERTIHQFALISFSSGDAADHYNPRDASQLSLGAASGNAKEFFC
jgi:hypothetical protein